MKVIIENDNVRVEANGLELLKLKSTISLRTTKPLISGKDFIEFPVSLLPFVSDLIDRNVIDSNVENSLEQFRHHEIARKKSLEIIDENSQSLLPLNWSNILDPAQVTAVDAMTVSNLLGLCLFDEQGSGKTVMSIAAFDILKNKGEIDGMIVICPKSMVTEWPKDIHRFLGTKYKVEIAEGNKQQKYNSALRDFDVLVTNYEGVETILVSLSASAYTRRYLLVVDESYYLKNRETFRSDNIAKLREKCHKCFVLCGTPAPNSSHDLVNQFDLADLGYTFGGFKKSKDPILDWDKIASLIETRGTFIRRLKPEILQHVPDKDFHLIRVELKGKQALMYEKARSDLELELRNLNNETFKKQLVTYFQKRAALLQICSCPSVIDPTISETSAKYIVLDKLLDEIILQGRKVVLWSFYKKSLDEVYTRYSKYKPVRVDGSVSSSARKEAVRSFQEDPSTMLFIGNPAAAGAGITLHAAYDAIYLSYSNQAAHYLQSLDRIHRRGQVSNKVNYYLLVCQNTIEETEIVRLRGKEIRQHDLLGDDIAWPTSLDDALGELGHHD